MSLNLSEKIKIAYKKLKSSVYFDKTLLPLRNDIVEHASSDIDEKLEYIAECLENPDDSKWIEYSNGILDEINVLVYPKLLDEISNEQIIFNSDNEAIRLKQAQYFIDLPVEGHILGILWILSIGLTIDDRNISENPRMYEHSYGNRLRKTLTNKDSKDITYSPYLFEPYFSQYEKWRDQALEYAKEKLENKQDTLVLSLDFKSFFYSVDISKNEFFSLLPKEYENWENRIHNFVYQVLQTYSKLVSQISVNSELKIKERTILPIGFHPSYILSNWVLTPFDDAVIKQVNPVYYGRYVDDIIIVDKVEKNSPLRKIANGNSSNDSRLTVKDIIKYYFMSCNADRAERIAYETESQIFVKLNDNELTPRQKAEDAVVYRINPNIFMPEQADDCNPDIQIQNEKIKVFYFRESSTRALLDCFKSQIAQNASEFRHLPDIEPILNENDYSEIYRLIGDGSPNKLRDVCGVKINKFNLSKFLGKYTKAGAMIRDKKENAFDKELLTIFNKRDLIENYTIWERLLEIMIINERYANYESLVKQMVDAIVSLEIPIDIVKFSDIAINHKYALIKTLYDVICRTAALCWGTQMAKAIQKITKYAEEQLRDMCFPTKKINQMRKDYCIHRMVNKYVMPLLIDCLKKDIFTDDPGKRNLCKWEDVSNHILPDWEINVEYKYYPYIITPQEISFTLASSDIKTIKPLYNPQQQCAIINELYRIMNYPNINIQNIECDDSDFALDKIKVARHSPNHGREDPGAGGSYGIYIESPSTDNITVAIGNAHLSERDFVNALTGHPNRSSDRYTQLKKLLSFAIDEKVEMLVLPECYLPWEWVPIVSRFCANNQIAIITGVEHVVSGDKVYNITAVMLPYSHETYKYAHVVFHQKAHFSPEEKRNITGYRLEPFNGNEYHLFQWHDVWFPVYCCFELASIRDRAIFQTIADLVVAVEWNKDIPYFSNIIESLCRDLHCYCIQANSSNYGDSRVISPSKTELRDIIKTKGGTNSAILVDKINIKALREFQFKEYELQRQDERYKPTPPEWNHEIVRAKQEGTLWEYLINNRYF